MKWGVETIVNEFSRTVELKLQEIPENSPIGEYHSKDYDMTFWSTYEEAVRNLNQVWDTWISIGSYVVKG